MTSPRLPSDSSMEPDGSSTSFSTLEKRALRLGVGMLEGWCRRLVLRLGVVRADNGCGELGGCGLLIDAWAVLTDKEDVGGPDEKMDLLGFENSGRVWEELASESWMERDCSLDEARRDSIRDGLALRRAGEDIADGLLRLRSAMMFRRLREASCSSDSSWAILKVLATKTD